MLFFHVCNPKENGPSAASGRVLLTMKSRVTTRVPERCQASPGACRGRICYSSLPLTCCLVERLAPGGGRSPLLCVVLIAAAVKKVCIRPVVFYALKLFAACVAFALSLRRDSELPLQHAVF